MSAGRGLCYHLIRVEIGDVIKQRCGCNQFATHTHLILTKRPERMQAWVSVHYPVPLPHIFLGTSVEDQQTADTRIPWLIQTPAGERFLSVEPLLGPVKLDLTGIGWVIVGAESGPKRRPMDLAWLEAIAAQCDAEYIPLYVKQDGALRPGQQGRIPDALWDRKEFPLPF